MFSYSQLQIIETVARTGSFSKAAESLHKVPSAVSYTVKTVEQTLAVTLFIRHPRHVEPTKAGLFFVNEIKNLLKQMDNLKHRTQQVANGWGQSVTIALDNIVKESQVNQLVRDFYRTFSDVELHLTMEVFNGVWNALADERADIAIGATTAVPVGGDFAHRDMGNLKWKFVVAPHHPLAQHSHPLNAEEVALYPAVCLEDTSRTLPKRLTWLMDNQRRLMVPNWHSALQCLKAGLGVSIVPSHMATPLIEKGELLERTLSQTPPLSPCCLAWNKKQAQNPAVAWILDYLGDSKKLYQDWIGE